MTYQISLRYVAKWRRPDTSKSGGKKRIRIIIIIKDQGFSGTLDRSFHYYKSVTNTVLKIFQYSFTRDVPDPYFNYFGHRSWIYTPLNSNHSYICSLNNTHSFSEPGISPAHSVIVIASFYKVICFYA